MYSDGSEFYRRKLLIINELRKDEAPTTNALANLARCSSRTISRTIDKLCAEFNVPIEYCRQRKGYILTDPNYQCDLLPPGKDELAAVFFMRLIADQIGDQTLLSTVDQIWALKKEPCASSNIIRTIKY